LDHPEFSDILIKSFCHHHPYSIYYINFPIMGVTGIKFHSNGTIIVWIFVLFFALTCMAAVYPVSAHAPANAGFNEDISNATVISNPEKSYAFYTDLDQSGEAQYYKFSMQKGQQLSGTVQIPDSGSMVPDIVIIGPGIVPSGNIPSFIEVPAGSGAMVIDGTKPEKPTYEPFTPQPIYEVAHFNLTVPEDGDYYIAVYGPGGGNYGLAPGFLEQFTISEWLLIPFSVISIYLWAGQSLSAVVTPFLFIVIAGLALLIIYQKKSDKQWGYREWIVLFSGLLYLGGVAVTITQTIHTLLLTGYSSGVLLTLIFIVIPSILGIVIIRKGLSLTREKRSVPLTGLLILIAGLLGLIMWAGFIIGPVLAILGGTLVIIHSMKKPQ
jgi:hypothetical protein